MGCASSSPTADSSNTSASQSASVQPATSNAVVKDAFVNTAAPSPTTAPAAAPAATAEVVPIPAAPAAPAVPIVATTSSPASAVRSVGSSLDVVPESDVAPIPKTKRQGTRLSDAIVLDPNALKRFETLTGLGEYAQAAPITAPTVRREPTVIRIESDALIPITPVAPLANATSVLPGSL
jgi:hypothetical protein